jgi:hypothetical protein
MLVDVLYDVICQACYCSVDKEFDSGALTVYAEALLLLDKYGRVKIIKSCGRRIIGKKAN